MGIMTAAGQRVRRAYIGSFTSAGGRGITVAEVDPDSGALRALGHTATVPDPSFLALTPDGRALCAVGETADGVVGVFSLADPDRPAPIAPAVSVRGASPTHLAVTARRVYTANYTSGSVSAVPLADGVRPQAPPLVTRHHGSGPVAARQAEPHAHAVAVAPGGNWLLAVDLGTDEIWIYSVDPGDGGHRLHGRQPLRAGTGPRHLAFHPDGRHLYVIHELEPVLTHCRWDAAEGRLTVRGQTRVLPAGDTVDSYPSGLAVAADGTRLYAAVRGPNRIAVLGLSPADGSAELLDTVDCGGDWPRALALHPDGRRLYVANERSGDVSWFDLRRADGVPSPAGALPAPAASCVIFR
jgi:6-phosphogluconolactonase (cycloisomerase 2 family)